MKISTINLKKSIYTENHNIYVGTHIGSFKRVAVNNKNPYQQINLQMIDTLSRNSRITSMEYGNQEQNEILIGRANKFVQVYNLDSDSINSSVEFSETPVVGLARVDEKLIAGLGTGKIEILDFPKSTMIETGDNISSLRQCKTDRRLIATGGRERQNNLKIFDLNTAKKIFSSKNLPNDSLQLEVPIWDSDIGFIDANLISTCSRYGYVRLYDIRTQRRPIRKYADEETSFSCLTTSGNNVYVGTTWGKLHAFDIRNFNKFLHTYKGFVGTVSGLDVDPTGKYIASSCLDRNVRVHHTDSCVLLYQCYVVSQATRILLKDYTERNVVEQDEDCIITKEGDSDEEETHTRQNGKSMKRSITDSDEEYDELFDRMQKVSESSEEENEEQNEQRQPVNKKKKK